MVLNECIVDNDDDGETAAGGRLAHLLQILVRVLYLRIYDSRPSALCNVSRYLIISMFSPADF